MKTSQEWWNEVKADNLKFIAWLQKQYVGEVTAADRIEKYAISYAYPREERILRVIAAQELKHAHWVADLLLARGVEPSSIDKETPYWDATLHNIDSLASATAVAALAEKMRLERIRVIANDESAPEDVRTVFTNILGEELFHEAAFRNMSNPEAIQAATAAHENGLEAIGLIMVHEVL